MLGLPRKHISNKFSKNKEEEEEEEEEKEKGREEPVSTEKRRL